jgi:hypothetical protein
MRAIIGGGATVAIVLLAALPATAAARPTVVPSSAERSTTVPAGGARSLTLTCPANAVALHAAPVRLPSGVRVADSAPGHDVRRWSLRFASVARRSRSVSATVRCVRLHLPAGISDVTLRVSTTSRDKLRVPAGSSVQVPLRCAPGFIPAGQGVGAGTRAVSVSDAVPNGNGWVFRIENNGKSAAAASARIRCLQRVVRGRRKGATTRLRFDVKHVTFSVPIRKGRRRSFTGSCARDRFSLGTGISIDRTDDITLLRSFPLGSRGGSWFLRNRGAAEPVTGYLLCLSRASRFG